jgi:beta-glucanase (GH16 family)
VKGTWPAFWMLGNNINEDPYNGANVGGQCWPLSTAREVDVWEWVRNNNGASYINNGIISNGGCNSAVHQSTNTPAWNWNDWVIASVKIDGGRVKFYRGGIKTHDIPDTGLANEDFAVVLNLAVSGMLGGSSQDFNGTDDWAAVEVDYVTHETW